jgi:hypothetical protein
MGQRFNQASDALGLAVWLVGRACVDKHDCANQLRVPSCDQQGGHTADGLAD